MDSFTLFNLSEGIFWLGLGAISFLARYFLAKKYHKISLAAGLVFSFFGLSDFVEIKTGGFIYEPWWLLWWKIANTTLVAALIVWYFKIRFRES